MVFPHPVFVIGSYNEDGTPNIMTASWSGICCSRPPAIAVSLRPATLTHGNIQRTGCFTVNIPGRAHVAEADYAGLVSGREGDKFAALGLTPQPSQLVDAPCVAEFPFWLECRLLKSFELGMHTQFVGEIVEAKVDEDTLDEQGRPDISRVAPLIYASGDRSYYAVGERIAKAFSVGRRES